MKIADWLDFQRPPLAGWALVVLGLLLGGGLVGAAFSAGYVVGHVPVRALRQEIRALHVTGQIIRLPDGRAAWCAPARADSSVGHPPTRQRFMPRGASP